MNYDEFLKTAATRAPRIEIVRWDAIELPTSSNWLVRDLIPREGVVIVWGPPKSGKSFWLLDLLGQVARGMDYRDHAVQQGAVVYCAFEGERGWSLRVTAWKQRLAKGENPPLYVMRNRLDLATHAEALADIISEMGIDPVAIALDTLNRSLRGSESSDRDMGAWIDGADLLRERFKCAVIGVHHCGHDDSRLRGHSSLLGGVAAELSVKRTDELVIAKAVMVRDGEPGAEIVSKLKQVLIGTDDDGADITSCIIEPAAPVPARAKKPESRMRTARQKNAFKALCNMVDKVGSKLPAAWGPPLCRMNGVPVEEWFSELISRGTIQKPVAGDRTINPRARFDELKESLKSKEVIGERDGLVWPVLAYERGLIESASIDDES